MFWILLKDVLKLCYREHFNLIVRLEKVLKMSWRRFQNVLKTSWRRFQNVLKTSGKRLQDVLKMFCKWTRLEDILARRLEDVLKRSWKLLEDVLKTHGQDEYIGLDQHVLKKTSSEDVRLRRTYSSWSRRLKTSSEDEDERRLQDVFKTTSSRRMFAGLDLARVAQFSDHMRQLAEELHKPFIKKIW